MAAPLGSLVLAAANGVVLSAGWARGYGNAVVISHGHGLTTRYAHLERGLVHSGETIELGQPIGQVGATGHATGNHLHFEIRVGNKALDPARPDLSFCDIASGTERPMAERLKEVAARPIWTNPAADDKLPTNLLN